MTPSGKPAVQVTAMAAVELVSCSPSSSPFPQDLHPRAESASVHDTDITQCLLPSTASIQVTPNLAPTTGKANKRKKQRASRKKRKSKKEGTLKAIGLEGPDSDKEIAADEKRADPFGSEDGNATALIDESGVDKGKWDDESTKLLQNPGLLSRKEAGATSRYDGESTNQCLAGGHGDEEDTIVVESMDSAIARFNAMVSAQFFGNTNTAGKDEVEVEDARKTDSAVGEATPAVTGLDDSVSIKAVDAVDSVLASEEAVATKDGVTGVDEGIVAGEPDFVGLQKHKATGKQEEATVATVLDAAINAEGLPPSAELGKFDVKAAQNVVAVLEEDCEKSRVESSPKPASFVPRVDHDLQEEEYSAIQETSSTPRNASIKELSTVEVAKNTFEVRNAPGKGLGMFAKKRIPRGTRIIEEEALMVVPEMSFSAILPVFVGLGPKARAKFMELAGAEDEKEVGRVARFLEEEERRLGLSQRIDMGYTDQARTRMIFRSNSFNIDRQTSAIFPTASRMNHSCLPNVYNTWNENIRRLTVHALRDIDTGEEILTTYIPATLDREKRNDKEHLGNYDFVCSCPACDSGSGFFEESAPRREIMVAIVKQLAPYFAHDDLREAFIHKVGSIPGVQEALHFSQVRADLLMDEGIINMELVKWYVLQLRILTFISDDTDLAAL